MESTPYVTWEFWLASPAIFFIGLNSLVGDGSFGRGEWQVCSATAELRVHDASAFGRQFFERPLISNGRKADLGGRETSVHQTALKSSAFSHR